MKKIVAGLLLSLFFLLQAQPAFAAASCQWTKINNALSYCVGGFDQPQDAQNYHVEFQCTKNCTSNLLAYPGPGPVQSFPVDDGHHIFQLGSDGKYFTCLQSQGYDQSVTDTVNTCESRHPELIACAVGGATGGTIAAATLAPITGGGSLLTIPISFVGAAAGCLLSEGQFKQTYLNGCAPIVDARVVANSGTKVCDAELHTDITVLNKEFEDQKARFDICNQVPPDQTDRVNNCRACATSFGVWTSVGCINYTPQAIIGTLVKVGLGIAGGVALMMILAAAFLFSTSQGDPKRTGQAKDLLTSAVIGLLFVIFSVTILQFIGVTVLHLPGFGS